MRILVTGGAGYIGSHAALRLLEQGHSVIIYDNLYRGHREVVDILRSGLRSAAAYVPPPSEGGGKGVGEAHVRSATRSSAERALDPPPDPLPSREGGQAGRGSVEFIHADIRDQDAVLRALRSHSIEAVMHFAALTYVGESVQKPELYRAVNVDGTRALLAAMDRAGVDRLIFSSSAAVYGQPPADQIPINEDCELLPINPYGSTKLVGEQLVAAWVAGEPESRAAAMLRYFNVAGADPTGGLGEDHDPETHLIPICLQAALGVRPHVTVFGTDYATPDGTCLRDYVHVTDLANAHIAALEGLKSGPRGPEAFNVGLGRAFSVREVVESCRRISGVEFEVVEGDRREGDPPLLQSDAGKIFENLWWRPTFTDLDAIVESAWRWHRTHPRGYMLSA